MESIATKKEKIISTSVIFAAAAIIYIWNLWLPCAVKLFNDKNSAQVQANPDFHAYYTAGKCFLAGDNPYRQTDDTASALGDQRQDGFTRFIYPPAFLPLYGLLAGLDYDISRILWLFFYLTVFLSAVLLTAGACNRQSRRLFLCITAAITLTSYPFLFHIRQGQVDLIVAALITGSAVLYAMKKKILSAIVLSIACLAKVNPVLMTIYFVLYFLDLRYLLYLLLSSVFIVWFSIILGVDFGLYRTYITEVLPSITGGTSYYYNQSLVRFWSGDAVLARYLPLAAFGIFSCFAWFAGRRFKRNSREAIHDENSSGGNNNAGEVVFVLNCLVILLFSGIAWHMTYVWLILPAAILLTGLAAKGQSKFLVFVIPSIILINARLYNLAVANSLNFAGNIILVVVLVFYILKAPAKCCLGLFERNAR